MKKFKVGDKVRLRKNVQQWGTYDGINMFPEMYRKMKGKTMTIEEIDYIYNTVVVELSEELSLFMGMSAIQKKRWWQK